ncbi:hypothetical protein [Hymenobacter sediminicola]|uniref:Uncharacterized protein n=1 Tax=Hymenobacter sediminicola TaxID=2761579 RepID=A0A7G7W9J7_9BACT|nr:hypothetical protein [Hymenobacter sediminicola]QNH63040.1 hypothetical protein H4317_04310 [Hymenobacter sediminicola]
MKKLFSLLIVGGCSLLSFSALAQQGTDKLRSEAMEVTRHLASHIALDDARSVQVRRLTYDRLVQESQINTMYGDDPAMRQNKLRVVEQEYAEKLKTVLTEAQYQRYLASAVPAQSSLSSSKPAAVPTKTAGH